MLPQNTTYLGVPLCLSKSRNKDFRFIKEKLDNKLCGWKSQKKSWLGRATLVKSVAQAILVYAMSTILLPKGLCDQLGASVRRFWWNLNSKSGPYWTLMSWLSLCWHQKEGGLGFRYFWDLNQALLSKLGWWIISGNDCLCVQVLRAKNKVPKNWLSHSSFGNASPFWKSLMGIKNLVAKAACLQVGNGASIRTWFDPWIPNLPGFIRSLKEGANSDLALVVSQLLTLDRRNWDMSKLNYLFEEPVVELILNIPIPVFQNEDCWAWTASKFGLFSVKYAY